MHRVPWYKISKALNKGIIPNIGVDAKKVNYFINWAKHRFARQIASNSFIKIKGGCSAYKSLKYFLIIDHCNLWQIT